MGVIRGGRVAGRAGPGRLAAAASFNEKRPAMESAILSPGPPGKMAAPRRLWTT